MISCLPTIAKAVHQIRQGELTSTELVEFCLRQIERHEPQIAAWILVDHSGARRAAELLDEQASRGELAGPLHGIPIGIKDIIDVQGWPTVAGSPTRAGHTAGQDAALVAQLRAAGAIILGKTVTTEFACFDPASTRNPWNLEQTPGGSSSGSAAAVASEMCMAAIGTQTGGSIIRPASYCGVCGLKPTLGQVSLQGVVPVSGHLDHAGPITRSVDDAARVFFALVTPAARASLSKGGDGKRDSGVPPNDPPEKTLLPFDWLQEDPECSTSSVDISPLIEYFGETASTDVWECFETALERLGPSILCQPPLPLPVAFANLHERHRRVMAVDAAAYHRQMFAARPHDFGPNITALIQEGLGERAVDYIDAVQQRERFRDAMCELLGDDTLAVTPATTTTAPHRETTGDPSFNSPWSYAGLPTITIPCGVAADGLPCGLQIIGPPHSELCVLRAARLCEKSLGFDQSPPL